MQVADEPSAVAPTPSSNRAVLGSIAIVVAVLCLSTALAVWAKDDHPQPIARVNTPRHGVPIVDSFSRPNRIGLGPAEAGGRWVTVSGTWTTAAGRAVVRRPAVKGPNIAVIDARGPISVVQMTAAHVGPNTGLVFRYSNPFNHWALIAAPRFASWNLQRVVDGQRTSVKRIAPAATADGTTVMVKLSPTSVEVVINGRTVASVRDRALNDATRVGMLVGEGGGNAAFDAITAVPSP